MMITYDCLIKENNDKGVGEGGQGGSCLPTFKRGGGGTSGFVPPTFWQSKCSRITICQYFVVKNAFFPKFSWLASLANLNYSIFSKLC